MELFYSRDIEGGICRLDQDESGHCIKVLRHRNGDEISVIDGHGTLYRCRITSDSHKAVEAVILDSVSRWGAHPYRLHLAVCPTKNNDRYEWFAEKACEMGVDELSPVIGDHSERKVLKTPRIEKILVSAAKQSLKASVPVINEPLSVKEFIAAWSRCYADNGICRAALGAGAWGNAPLAHAADSVKSTADSVEDTTTSDKTLKLIAYCFEDENVPRRSIREVLDGFEGTDIIVMIGPEGDFSKEEAEMALAAGFIPVHLGASRLRTETAALAATAAVYLHFIA